MAERKTETQGRKTAPAPRAGGGIANFCLLTLAAATIGLAAPKLAHVWLGFDALSHFVPHFAALAVGALICLVYPNWRGLLALLALPIMSALVVSGVSLWHASPGFEMPPQQGRIRVMGFNILSRNHDLAAIEAEVRRNRPDILAMPEFHKDKWPLQTRLRDMFPHQANCAHKKYCNLALFSRWPIASVKAASRWLGPPYLHAIVRMPQGPVHVFVVHTLRFPWLGSQYKQMGAMARIVRMQKGPVIVIGDFNASPFSITLERFLTETGLQRLTWLPTWPAWPLPLPQLAIDHVFVSGHWRLAAGPWVGAAAGSDHLPVILEIAKVETDAANKASRH